MLVEITASHWSEKSDRFECPSVTSQLVWLRMKVFFLQYGCLLDNIFQIIKINYDTGRWSVFGLAHPIDISLTDERY